MRYELGCTLKIEKKTEFFLGKTHLFDLSEDGITLFNTILNLTKQKDNFTVVELDKLLPDSFDRSCETHTNSIDHLRDTLDFLVECTVLKSSETPLFEVADNEEARKIVLAATIVGGASSSILNPTSPST